MFGANSELFWLDNLQHFYGYTFGKFHYNEL